MKIEYWENALTITKEMEYWKNVFKAKEDLYLRMSSISGRTIEGGNIIDPSYNQIKDNGGIGLKFDNGYPYRLYIPLGSIPIASSFFSHMDRERLFYELVEDYGLVSMDDDSQDSRNSVYSITKLPWSKQNIPVIAKKEEFTSSFEAREEFKVLSKTIKTIID